MSISMKIPFVAYFWTTILEIWTTAQGPIGLANELIISIEEKHRSALEPNFYCMHSVLELSCGTTHKYINRLCIRKIKNPQNVIPEP